MKKLEPYAVMGDFGDRSESERNTQAIRRSHIAVKARNQPKEQFNNLMHHLTFELVWEQLIKVPKNSSPGGDGMTVKQCLENLDWLLPPILDAIHKGEYEAPPVRRVYIPKATGGNRPIGIPEILDRAIQAAMATILNEIYEQDFVKSSFGFRPKIGCHHALATVNVLLGRSMNHALEVDLRDFFGSLKHEWLRKFLRLRIGDNRVHKLIDSWLRAGVMENGKWQEVVDGTPQGGSISPLLANIYLHYALDLWWERKIQRRLSRRAHLVRYCDDFLILFSTPEDMHIVKPLLNIRLGQFGLSVAEEKTHLTDLTPRGRREGKDRRQITFLGFTIIRAKTRKGTGWKTVFKTEAKRFSRAKEKLKERIHKVMHLPVETQARVINSLLVGHYNYYGIAGNGKRLNDLSYYAMHIWRRSLSKRSQRGRVSWDELKKIIEKTPLSAPRINLTYAKLNDYVRL